MDNLVNSSSQKGNCSYGCDLRLKKRTIRFDPGYIITISGLLKVAEIIICTSGLICIQRIHMATYHSAGQWYYFVSMSGICISLFFFICYVFHVPEKCKWFPWLPIEAGYAVVFSVFFSLAGYMSGNRIRVEAVWATTAVIGFIAAGIYAFEAFRKYRKWKKDEATQDCYYPRQTSRETLTDTEI